MKTIEDVLNLMLQTDLSKVDVTDLIYDNTLDLSNTHSYIEGEVLILC